MKYALTIEKVYDEENKAVEVYGIAAIDEGEVLKSVSDVFTDKNVAESFIDICNQGHLSIIHLDDVIADIIETSS